VVHLVEDDERLAGLRARPMQRGMRRDLRVGDRDAGKVGADGPLCVAVGRVDRDAEPLRRLCPLVLQVLGGRHDRERRDLPPREQLDGHREGVGGLTGTGRRYQQEVTLGGAEILFVGSLLPAAEGRKQILPNGRS
jgi:hypothetical protein